MLGHSLGASLICVVIIRLLAGSCPVSRPWTTLKRRTLLAGLRYFPISDIHTISSLGGSQESINYSKSRSQSGCADQNDARGKVHHRCGCHEEVATVRPGDQTQVRVYLICRQLGRNCEAVKLLILRVVVKCDIEGGELGVVADMVVTGAMEVVHNFQLSKQFIQFLCMLRI